MVSTLTRKRRPQRAGSVSDGQSPERAGSVSDGPGTEAGSLAHEPRSGERSHEPVIYIPLEKLHAHPDNRTITPASVAGLMASMAEHGQHEPIRVRALDDPLGHYQILSGGRRFVAATELRLPSLRAIVEESHEDTAALIDLAVANAERQDLDPIERSQLLQRMIDAGVDRAAAGRIFGLGSDSGIKNALRLLQLPDCWQQQLRDGQLSVKQARQLVPYPTEFLLWLHGQLQQKHAIWTRERFYESDDGPRNAIKDMIATHCRPLGEEYKHYHGYQVGSWPALFKLDALTEQQRKKLQLVEIPAAGKQGTTRMIALNAKAWHTLQDPLVQAKLEAKKSRSSARQSGDKSKPATPAELARRRAEQDEQLHRYTRTWLLTALRCSIAQAMREDIQRTGNVTLWVLAAVDTKVGDLMEWAASQIAALHDLTWKQGAMEDPCAHVSALDAVDLVRDLWWATIARVAVWPVADPDRRHVDLAEHGTLPERLPLIDAGDVTALASLYGVSAETFWQ